MCFLPADYTQIVEAKTSKTYKISLQTQTKGVEFLLIYIISWLNMYLILLWTYLTDFPLFYNAIFIRL